MTDKLDDELEQQLILAHPIWLVPAKGVPPAEVPWHKGPPGRSQKAPAFFCGTGASLPRIENSVEPISDLSRSVRQLDEQLSELAQHQTLCGVHCGNPCSCTKPIRGLLELQKSPDRKPDSHSRDARVSACFPPLDWTVGAGENSETENPTVSSYETAWWPPSYTCAKCGAPLTIERGWLAVAKNGVVERFCNPCGEPIKAELIAERDAPEPWAGCRAFVEAEARVWSGYLVADGHEEPLDYSLLLPGMRKTAMGPAPTNLAAKVEARRRVANSWADHLEAIGNSMSGYVPPVGGVHVSARLHERDVAGCTQLAMSPEYRRSVEGPDYVPTQGALAGAELLRTLRRPDPEKALMMAGTVAGHTFEGVGSDARCGCGKYRDDLREHNREWIGQQGHAHVGELTAREYDQIEEMWVGEERFWEAVAGVSSGR